MTMRIPYSIGVECTVNVTDANVNTTDRLNMFKNAVMDVLQGRPTLTTLENFGSFCGSTDIAIIGGASRPPTRPLIAGSLAHFFGWGLRFSYIVT